MRAAATLAATFALLGAILAVLNDLLAPCQVHLYAAGLFVAGAVFSWPTAAGGAALFLAGCVADANAPPELFGAQTALFCAAYLVLRALPRRFPGEETSARVAAALAINLALFLALSALRGARYPDPGAAALRLGFELAASELFVALAAPWFFALQARALALARARPE